LLRHGGSSERSVNGHDRLVLLVGAPAMALFALLQSPSTTIRRSAKPGDGETAGHTNGSVPTSSCWRARQCVRRGFQARTTLLAAMYNGSCAKLRPSMRAMRSSMMAFPLEKDGDLAGSCTRIASALSMMSASLISFASIGASEQPCGRGVPCRRLCCPQDRSANKRAPQPLPQIL
jgi:hypothetical protein